MSGALLQFDFQWFSGRRLSGRGGGARGALSRFGGIIRWSVLSASLGVLGASWGTRVPRERGGTCPRDGGWARGGKSTEGGTAASGVEVRSKMITGLFFALPCPGESWGSPSPAWPKTI